MNRFFWIINLALLAVATAITLTALRRAPPARPGMTATTAAAPLPVEPGDGTHDNTPPAEFAALDGAHLSPIWQRSLFRPERQEEEASGEQKGDGGLELPCNLELVGVGVLGSIAAAIICATEQPAAAPARMDAFSGREIDPGKKKKSASKRHVYKVGQTVGDSGFTVKSVSFDTVILARGTQEHTLKLKKSNSGRAKGSLAGKAGTADASAAKGNSPATRATIARRQLAEPLETAQKVYLPATADSRPGGAPLPTSERLRQLRGAGGTAATPAGNGMDNNRRQRQEELMKSLSASQR